jgi:hypothetical protein
VAAGSTNPPGVVAILNFAGGRGAFKPDLVCSPDRLVDAFGALGRTARSTALWLFAENDHSFGPALAGRMFDAYTASGAPAQLKMLPPFGADGHLLPPNGSSDLWWPSVEAFLAALHLPTALGVEVRPPSPLPAPPVVGGSRAVARRRGRRGDR